MCNRSAEGVEYWGAGPASTTLLRNPHDAELRQPPSIRNCSGRAFPRTCNNRRRLEWNDAARAARRRSAAIVYKRRPYDPALAFGGDRLRFTGVSAVALGLDEAANGHARGVRLVIPTSILGTP